MMKNRSIAFGLIILSTMATIHSLSAATINFDSNADFDDNFWVPAGANPGATVRDSSGYLQKTGTLASATIYNTNSTGGSGGTGGTAGGLPQNTFTDLSYAVDFSTSTFSGGNSIGLYTKLNDTATSGYVAFFRITSATTADFRIFEDADATVSGAGTQVGSALQFTTTGSFSTNTFYTFQLDVEDVGADVQFTASMFNAGGGSQIGSTLVITDTVSAVTGTGQVGMRLNSTTVGSNIRVDNFTVNAIPEPTSAAFLIGGLMMAALRRKRA